MGLLTGFSIISGVEIIFFIVRSVDKYIYISCGRGLNATVKKVLYTLVFPIFRLICSLDIITNLWMKLREKINAIQQRASSK